MTKVRQGAAELRMDVSLLVEESITSPVISVMGQSFNFTEPGSHFLLLYFICNILQFLKRI